MEKKYTQDELNKILLSKELGDFYFAIIENCGVEIQNAELNSKLEGLMDGIINDGYVKDFFTTVSEIVDGIVNKRYLGIVTVIDNDVFDIGTQEFVDLDKSKIVHFDNLKTFFDDSTARLTCVTQEELPALNGDTVLLEVTDDSIIPLYEAIYVLQPEDDDVTEDLIKASKGRPLQKEQL